MLRAQFRVLLEWGSCSPRWGEVWCGSHAVRVAGSGRRPFAMRASSLLLTTHRLLRTIDDSLLTYYSLCITGLTTHD